MKDKKKITKIKVFDFDGTLMKTPERKEGIEMWEKYYGEKFVYKDWWGNPASLDLDVFGDFIETYKNVYFEYLLNIKKQDTWVIMLTHRKIELKEYVDKVLKKFNISFDDELFRVDRFHGKEDSLDYYIADFDNLEEIVMWEDNDGHIQKIREWAYKVSPWLDIKVEVIDSKLLNN